MVWISSLRVEAIVENDPTQWPPRSRLCSMIPFAATNSDVQARLAAEKRFSWDVIAERTTANVSGSAQIVIPNCQSI